VSIFANFKLLPAIQKSLESLGFTTPTEIQEKIIPILLENPKQDVHAQAQTGTGKTLAFGIPLLHVIDPASKTVQALVVAPTRELVLQIYEALKDVSRQTGISIEPIYGGMSMERQIEGIRRGAQIIIGTPGRLNDHLRRKTLSLNDVKVLVLDEADIMLDMGFKEEVDKILTYTPHSRNIWLFSATVKAGIKGLITSHMHDVLTIRAMQKNVASAQVKQYYSVVQRRKRTEAAARFIEAAPDFYGIIFCQTKMLTSEVTEQLASRGLRVNCLHGDMSQNLRNQVIKGFKNKDFTIMVATDVAARGIDVSDLTHVINYSLPEEHENYIHRIGRTGRAGKEGIAILFVATSEMYRLKRLERSANTTLQEIPIPSIASIIAAKMSAVSDFIEQAKKPHEKLSEVHTALKELIDSFTEEEIRQSLASALEDKFFKDMTNENLADVRPATGVAPKEICIDRGRDDGMSEDDVRDYLHKMCKLVPQDISKVRVLNKKTFISISESRLTECMNRIRQSPILNQKARVSIVEDVFRGKQDRPRDRSDRFEKDDRGGFGKRRSSSNRSNSSRSNASRPSTRRSKPE